MSTVALPDGVTRLAGGFADAAPGHRFLLYLPMWSAQSWAFEKDAKTLAAKASTQLPDKVRALGQAVRARQQALAQSQSALTLLARSTAPFTTGLGNEHPIDNGFAFLTPYGLPYLAGSGVKGVLRRAMQELCKAREPGFTDESIGALFGPENVDKPEDARRGVLDFWDCLPDGTLEVDTMTPHQTQYYEGKQTPHDAGLPVPVPFLTVAPGAAFHFHVVCHEARLTESLRGEPWCTLLTRAFELAFDWLGFGAKTAVGYGAMTRDAEAEARRQREKDQANERVASQQARARRQAELDSMSPAEREIGAFLDARQDKNQPELASLLAALKKGQWTGTTKIAAATRVKSLMQQSRKWKEKSEKKNPEKDHDHQDTVQVMKWLAAG